LTIKDIDERIKRDTTVVDEKARSNGKINLFSLLLNIVTAIIVIFMAKMIIQFMTLF